eukprot:TRINITY_DN3917_c0_g1_i1.p1 TRINITY_DN3917_c0_g1~~TRINITY_DN3917_c0_g1_i1.p1  ORF type:complete len:101 (-),score=44.01 TRINITY_DN3917_c0_g1_i1:75-377(-)
MQDVDTATETLNNLNATYLSRISIEVAASANRTNNVMKKLSAVATIMMPLTLVAGLFGMNVPVPGGTTTSLWWFFGIAGTFFLIVCIAVIIFMRVRWITF